MVTMLFKRSTAYNINNYYHGGKLMVNYDAITYLPDGSKMPIGEVKGGIQIIDMFGYGQTIRRTRNSNEKEYQYLKFDNGAELYTLTYLSIMTKDSEKDAIELKPGDKVMGYKDGKICDVTVTESQWVTVVNKKNLGMPKKVKMTFLETYEDLPIVVEGIVIGMRKQLDGIRQQVLVDDRMNGR